MKRLKRSPEKLKADRLVLLASIQTRKEAGLRAVEEMSKHPLSSEQKRAQIKRNHAEADRLEKAFARREEEKTAKETKLLTIVDKTKEEK
jgi:hypothetical protein